MIVLIVILLLLTSLLVWILVAPLIIQIDSRRSLYLLRLASIGHVQLLYENDQLLIEFQVLFFRKKIVPNFFKRKNKKEKPKKKQTKKRYSFSKIKSKGKRILKSFQLKKLWLNVDTDSYYHNSLLYPVFFFVKGKNYQLNINYEGQNELVLVVKNRLIRMLWAFFF